MISVPSRVMPWHSGRCSYFPVPKHSTSAPSPHSLFPSRSSRSTAAYRAFNSSASGEQYAMKSRISVPNPDVHAGYAPHLAAFVVALAASPAASPAASRSAAAAQHGVAAPSSSAL
eukprot:30497-Pelagococcus_subviridis.AAC.55